MKFRYLSFLSIVGIIIPNLFYIAQHLEAPKDLLPTLPVFQPNQS